MFKSRKEKQIHDFADIYRGKYGVSMELEYTRLSARERLFVCLVKGILIFLCTYGSTRLFLTSFGLPSIGIVLFLFILIMSVAVAMFYYNRLAFNVGYILFFILICALAYFLYWYANSGMNAILNVVVNIVDDKLYLNGVREYEEMIKNRNVTVTCCLILISCLSICFYNSAISGYMSPLLTFLLLYPIAQICAYFDDDINLFYFGMMVLGFLGVCLLRKSGRYYMPYHGTAADLKVKGDSVYHKSARFCKTMSGMSLTACVIMLVLMIFAGVLANAAPRKYHNNYSTWKTGTDEVVKEFAVNGFMGFFNQYSAVGGLSEGRLGGVRQVMMTFTPQLEIKIVPDNVEGIYLRGFIGDYYESNQWSRMQDKKYILERQYGISDTTQIVNLESGLLSDVYESGASQYSAKAYMTVKNLSSPDKYFYTPYFFVVDYSEDAEINSNSFEDQGDYVLYNLRTKNRELKHTYYPYYTIRQAIDNGELETSSNLIEVLYRQFVYNNYLYVPKDIRDDLKEICDEHITGSNRKTVISQIYSYFEEEFKYTLSPGVTPRNRDFVVYFMNQQKKGYCAHFATAAAMLLRSKGIPARYVEGYHIVFNDATIVETDETVDVNDWYQGYNGTVEGDEEPSLIEVQARGADAHAWVEVYYDGFGWIPVEFTIAQADESTEGGSFWERFGGYFGSNETAKSPVDNVTEQLQNAAPFMAGLFGIAAGVVVLIAIVSFLRRKYRIYVCRNNERLVFQYAALSKLLRSLGISGENNIYHKTMKKYLETAIGFNEDDSKAYIELVERASFDNKALAGEELTEATNLFRQALTLLKKKLGVAKRLYVIWRI